MAKLLGKDEATYSKERDNFLGDLHHFHEIRGTSFKRCPTVGSQEIDLYLLYSLVTAQGGWIKVNHRNTWEDILPTFKLPRSCVNSSVALKQIYLRYLDRYEKSHFLGEDPDRDPEDDDESRHKRWNVRSLHAIPHTYNYAQHNVAEDKREYNLLDTSLYKPSDYDRLALSLISPLPNEQDFAINVCTLLSNDGKHTLKLEKHPRIVDYLLAHAGVFNHSSMRKLFMHFYKDIRRKPIHNFWADVLESEEYLDLTNETKFVTKSIEDKKPCDSLIKDDYLPIPDPKSKDCEIIPDEIECEILEDSLSLPKNFKFTSSPSDKELFCIRRTLGTQDYIGQRVLQIATILRNLCFIEENLSTLVKNRTFLRFLLLCATSQWNVLRNLGLDMLGNIASEYEIHDLTSDVLSANLLKIVSKNLQSDDRASCLSSIEVLNKLSQNDINEEMLLRSLESNVYKKVCSFLTIHDVMLLIYTLECLYSLSSLGERSCNFIANNHGVIDTLVSLVTVEGKSYGPRACIGMKLVETVPSSHHQQLMQQQQQNQQTTTQKTPAVSQTAVTPQQSTNTTINAGSTVNLSNTVAAPAGPSVTPVKNPPATPIRQVAKIIPKVLVSDTSNNTITTQATTIIKTELKPAVSTTTTTTASKPPTTVASPAPLPPSPALPPPLTPQQMIQQQHAHQQAIHENEQFALAWLRATYEPVARGRIDHQEVYKHYIHYCSKIGRMGVISPLHFPRCVRSIFGGTVGPNPIKPAKPTDPQFYDGIKVRDKPLHIKIPPPTPVPPLPSPTDSPNSPSASNSAAKVNRRNKQQQALKKVQSVPLDIDPANQDLEAVIPCSPISPILKAQLSQPPKQKDADCPTNSQAIAHPHLSQALLCAGSTSSSSTTVVTSLASMSTVAPTTSIKEIIVINKNREDDTQHQQQASAGGAMHQPQSSMSMIKSLLATKVAARQQRLLAQQAGTTTETPPQKVLTKTETLRMQRINGARNLFQDNDVGDNSVSSTTHIVTPVSTLKGKKEPPQPPPPLAPLSKSLLNEDSDSTSLSSGLGTVGVSTVSSTEDNDNSLTSFECLLNGMPNSSDEMITLHGAEDSDSKDSVKILPGEISLNKPLRLADLLEKKFEKGPLLLNGTMAKDNKIPENVDLVENHIEKALSSKSEAEPRTGLKRHATDQIDRTEAKRPHMANVNGSRTVDSSQPDSSSNGDDGPSNVSSAAAKLFADMAADILEDEDEDQLMQEAQPASAPTATPTQTTIDPNSIQQQLQHHQQQQIHHQQQQQIQHQQQQIQHQQQQIQHQQQQMQHQQQQIIMENNQLVMTQPRQIIVSQAQVQTSSQQLVFSGGTHLAKTQTGQTVIVQSPNVQQTRQVVIQPSSLSNAGGQIVLSQGIQGLQGGVQLVTSAQGGQYVLQTGGNQGIVVAQQQTAVVHGQPQTVLVAQNQQTGGPKTIIILQQQGNASTHHQKVMVTPQGQQVVVTQVPRPIAQTSTVSSSINQSPAKVFKMTNSPVTTGTVFQQQATPNGVDEVVEVKAKAKVLRDLTSPYVCEWGECDIKAKFRSVNEVYMHCVRTHIPQGNEELTCLWDRCDNIKRRRFSLMTHVQDKHCTMEALKQGLLRRKQTSQGMLVDQPQGASAQPVYAPDAAMHAIKRHAMEFINPKELQDDNEGPVTKSIRLTASLILRNLVIYSSYCKRYLKSYESHLANIALSNVESSRTVAQILYDINEGNAPR